MISDGSKHFLIPANYTSVFHPCDVVKNKFLKERLKKAVFNWRKDRNAQLTLVSRLPWPKWHEILESWALFGRTLKQIVRYVFKDSGYFSWNILTEIWKPHVNQIVNNKFWRCFVWLMIADILLHRIKNFQNERLWHNCMSRRVSRQKFRSTPIQDGTVLEK